MVHLVLPLESVAYAHNTRQMVCGEDSQALIFVLFVYLRRGRVQTSRMVNPPYPIFHTSSLAIACAPLAPFAVYGLHMINTRCIV